MRARVPSFRQENGNAGEALSAGAAGMYTSHMEGRGVQALKDAADTQSEPPRARQPPLCRLTVFPESLTSAGATLHPPE
jgi:hypothetical protein